MSSTKVLHEHVQHSLRPPLSPLELGPPSPPLVRQWPPLSSPKLCRRSFNHLLSPPGSPVSPKSGSPVFGRKKRVVFADARGLPLATVRYFTQEKEEGEEKEPASPSASPASPPAAETPPGVAWLPGPGGASQAGQKPAQLRPPARRGRHLRLWLGFPQPGADSAAFRARLQDELVLLESCRVTPESLSGTIRARNLGFEKSVHVRVTFDSWRSHRDVPCAPQKQAPVSPDSEVLTFDIPIPENLDPRERLEFCISFRHGKGALLWDRNGGQNYRFHASADSGTPAASLLASHRSSLLLHDKRKGLRDGLPPGVVHRSDSLATAYMTRVHRHSGADWRPSTPPGSPRI